MLWYGLITTRVARLAHVVLASGVEVDAALVNHRGPRLEVGELVARAMADYTPGLPLRDGQLISVLASRGLDTGVDLSTAGLLCVTRDGRLALTLGRGRVVESYGPAVCLTTVEASRYTGGFRLPNVMNLEAN